MRHHNFKMDFRKAEVMNSVMEIIPFESRYAADFKRLNLEWLQRYFTVEPIDEEVLSRPDAIIQNGGALLLARSDGRIVGTCALLHEGDGRFEVSKTAVTAEQQGKGIGRQLVAAAIAEFVKINGRELFLETNTALRAAIALYESLGFVHAPRPTPSHYARGNVYMIYRQLT